MSAGPSPIGRALTIPPATVLVVDDSPSALDSIREHLWALGIRVRVAHDGEEGLRQAHSQHPDLILLDIVMPGIDGFETCRRLKSDPLTADIPVIVMSALGELDNKLRAFELGSVDFLVKPIELAELAARIAVHLALREARGALRRETETHRRTAAELQQRSDELHDAMNRLLRGEQMILNEKLLAAGELSAGVAHEIANPAHAAFLASEELGVELDRFRRFLRDLAGDDAPAEVMAAIDARIDRLGSAIAIIRESTERVRTIANDLRVFARMDKHSVRCSLSPLLSSTINLARAQFKHEVDFDLQVINDPEIDCQPSRLGQVLMNLLINACQSIRRRRAEQPGGPTGRINARIERAGAFLRIDIEDNGCGISDHVRERMFEPFFTTKPAGEGTGLGLSLSARIVGEHGGSIVADSPSGQGARFRVELPLAADSTDPI